jgi:MerR family transcriptional regulator, copper efflux regulator
MGMSVFIGEAAKQSGASIKAIRLYESLGLIDTPLRRGSYRLYSPQAIETVRCIKLAQTFGFTLSEMRSLRSSAGLGFDVTRFNDAIANKQAKLAALAAQCQKQIHNLQTLQMQVQSPEFCDENIAL